MPGQTRHENREEKARRSMKVRRSGGRFPRRSGGYGAGQGTDRLPPARGRRRNTPAAGTAHHVGGGPRREAEGRTGGASFGGLRSNLRRQTYLQELERRDRTLRAFFDIPCEIKARIALAGESASQRAR